MNKEFDVKVYEEFGNIYLSVTHDGYQWSTISIRDPEHEIPKIIEALHLKPPNCSVSRLELRRWKPSDISQGPRSTCAEYEYARDLAIYLWENDYKNDAPGWEPCEDLMGVLTQIDNMITGLQNE